MSFSCAHLPLHPRDLGRKRCLWPLPALLDSTFPRRSERLPFRTRFEKPTRKPGGQQRTRQSRLLALRMSTTSSSPAPMILDAGYAWRSQELDIVMLEAVPARRRISSEGYQTPPQYSSRPLKRPHSPAMSPRPSSPAPGSKKVKPLPRPTTFSPKRRCTESERPSTPAPTPASKPKSMPAKPLLHRLAQTVTPQTSHEPVGLELEKVFAVGVGQGLVRRSREGSRLGRVAEAELEEEMEWE